MDPLTIYGKVKAAETAHEVTLIKVIRHQLSELSIGTVGVPPCLCFLASVPIVLHLSKISVIAGVEPAKEPALMGQADVHA